jgi:hypothetical protein
MVAGAMLRWMASEVTASHVRARARRELLAHAMDEPLFSPLTALLQQGFNNTAHNVKLQLAKPSALLGTGESALRWSFRQRAVMLSCGGSRSRHDHPEASDASTDGAGADT